jgi:chromosome segregation ATPase
MADQSGRENQADRAKRAGFRPITTYIPEEEANPSSTSTPDKDPKAKDRERAAKRRQDMEHAGLKQLNRWVPECLFDRLEAFVVNTIQLVRGHGQTWEQAVQADPAVEQLRLELWMLSQTTAQLTAERDGARINHAAAAASFDALAKRYEQLELQLRNAEADLEQLRQRCPLVVDLCVRLRNLISRARRQVPTT